MFSSRTGLNSGHITPIVGAIISVFALATASFFAYASVIHADAPNTWQVNTVGAGTCTTTDFSCVSLEAAIAAASDGDTIVLGSDIETLSQINVNKAITIDGGNHSLSPNFTKDSNSNNSAIGITHSGVEVHDLVINGTKGVSLHGVNVYLSQGVVLTNVTISDNDNAAVIVNGSDVTAKNLTTLRNGWGAVNVDPGSGVTAPSVFKLNGGSLGEDTQIWSDGGHVDASATVTVSASGYTKYLKAGTPAFYIWANKPVANSATLTSGENNTLYPSIQAAVDAATTGDTVTLSSDVTVTSEVLVSKGITIDGAGHTLFAKIDNTANSNSNNAGIGIVGATGAVLIKDITVDGDTSQKIHGVNVYSSSDVTLEKVTVQNNTKSGITVNGSTVTIHNVTTRNNAWGGINADQAASVTAPTAVTITGTSVHTENGPDLWVDNNDRAVTVNGTESQYSSAPYTHDTNIVGTKYGIKAATVSTEAELRVALGDSLIETITFGSNITLAAQVQINKSVTIKGNGHTLFAPFAGGPGNVNNSAIDILHSDVTIQNLNEDGAGSTGIHGFNIYASTGVVLDTVTSSNNSKAGITVNGSSVTVNNVTTSGNAWGGINVDTKISSPSVLTVNGISSHTETNSAIWIDDTTKSVSVVDANNQYVRTDTGTKRDYILNQKKITTTSSTQETITSGDATVTVEMPAGTVVKSTLDWDGILNAPTATSVIISVSGFTTGVTSAIEAGSSLSDLTFDKAAKLTFAGQAGKHVGWVNHAGTFTEITTGCTDNTQTTNNALAAGADCKLDVGNDLVVWTKHFSVFATYNQVANVSNGGSSGGGGTVSTTVTSTTAAPTTPVAGRVLGAETFTFSSDITIGSTGDEVNELQKVLISAGYLKITAPTGYFGALTKSAVKLYQGAHGVIATGYVGPLTRQVLNQSAPSTLTAEQKAANLKKIQELLVQVLDLQMKLAALTK